VISLRIARCCMCLYILCPFFNAFLTISFARPYRLALKKISEKTRLTSLLFIWIIERRRIGPASSVLSGEILPAATSRSLQLQSVPACSSRRV
jgi:hypothetical protein